MTSRGIEGALAEVVPHLVQAVESITDSAVTAELPAYERNLAKRVIIEEEIIERRKAEDRGRPEKWALMNGDYRKYYWDTDSCGPFDRPVSGEREEELDRAIREKLSSNEGKRPTVVVEFGAGYGLSLIRAGRRHAKQIEADALVLVATNLTLEPSSEPDDAGYTGIARYAREPIFDGSPSKMTDEELRLIENSQGLVRFVQANVLNILDLSVPTHKGELPLQNNTSVVVERDAMMHSVVPDLALAAFATLLTPEGELHLGTKEPNYMHARLLEQTTLDDEQIEPSYPSLALAIGRLSIEKHPFNMRLVKDKEDGPVIYRKAP